jgi:nitrate/nitrite-specific signal transduction histidine kinase
MRAIVRAVRQAVAAVSVAAAVVTVLRLRGRVVAPMQFGGWRRLTGPGLR